MPDIVALIIVLPLLAACIGCVVFARRLALRVGTPETADTNSRRIMIAAGVSAALMAFLAYTILTDGIDEKPALMFDPAAVVSEDPAEPPRISHPPGTTLRYTRSNQDGTEPETILVHIVSPTSVAVAKMVERCTSAALVTAEFDAATGEMNELVGGRLGRDARQEPQAYLSFDKAARRLDVRMGDPKSAPTESIEAPPAPWRLYDFDFADFALYGPRGPKDFTYGLALVWPDGSPALRRLGAVEAKLIDSGIRANQPFALYALTGAAYPGNDGGLLTLDPDYGHVIEARLGRPNHPGYTDYYLKLDAVEFGDQEWQDALAFHWKDCPR